MQYPDMCFPTEAHGNSGTIKRETIEPIETVESVENIPNVKTKTESPPATRTASTLRSMFKGSAKNKKFTRRPSKAQSMQPMPILSCRHCTKSFSKQSKLHEHENSHEPTPAVCHEILPTPEGARVCGKEYGRPADLARHHRSVSILKPSLVYVGVTNES